MERLLGYLIILAVILSAVACGQPGPPPVTPPPAAIRQEAAAKPAWETQWEKTLVEARKEGRVVVYGPFGADLRQAMIDEFQKAYPGIVLEYTALDGAEVAPKVTQERRAGLFLTDVHIGGPTTMTKVLRPFALPVEDFLILPKVKEGKNWLTGRLRFHDPEEKYVMVFGIILQPLLAYNPNLVSPEKMQGFSLWELTETRWKGKILWHDPRVGGFGRGVGWFIYQNAQLGKNWFKAAATNDILLDRNARLLLEWVGREKYPMLIGPDQRLLAELMNGGVPIKPLLTAKEGSFAGSGSSYIMVFDKAPHPNAGKVFINWFLDKEAQLVHSKVTGFASLRADVSDAHLPKESIPKGNYTWMFGDVLDDQKNEMVDFAKQVFGK